MFTFEIRINGSLIGHIYGHNESNHDDEGRDEYSFEYYEVATRDLTKGRVFHHRKDGIRKLISAILKKVDEE